MAGTSHKVFVSHSSADLWVARQIAAEIRSRGADVFLDEADIAHGDDFEDAILRAAETSDELLVLLTPWSLKRPYVLLEMGIFWGNRKRIVAVLHGLTPADIAGDGNVPVLLKRIDLISINQIESYFEQLGRRAAARERTDA